MTAPTSKHPPSKDPTSKAPTSFRFEGRTIDAHEGQTIGAALHAAGIRTLSWSAKYRRPRGLRCVNGVCPSCTVRVDGLPGVLACVTPVRGGEVVERIRPAAPWFPADRLSRFAPAGFYYEHLAHRPRLWRLAERILAHLSGQARPPAPGAAATGTFEERRTDLLVVGAGRSGLTAALAGARAGRSVLVVDRDHEPGGRLLSEPAAVSPIGTKGTDAGAGAEDAGAGLAARLIAEAQAAGVELLLGATDIGQFDEGVHGIVHSGGLIALEATEVHYATGSYDREAVLPDGDRPGVMLAGGAQRLLVREGVIPGRRAVIVEVDGHGGGIARLLADAGVEIAVRCSPEDVRAIRGRDAVESVELGDGRRIRCDLVVIAAGARPADEVARQAEVL